MQRVVVKLDTEAEQTYMMTLREHLQIAPETAAKLHDMLGIPAI